MPQYTSKKGFTTVELLIVMGVMGILLVILSNVFSSILTMKLRSRARTAVAQDSRYLLSRFSYDITRASDIVIPAPTQTNDTLTLTIDGSSYRYTLASGVVQLSVDGGTSYALNGVGTHITNLSFTQSQITVGKKSVNLKMTISPASSAYGDMNDQRLLETTIATR